MADVRSVVVRLSAETTSYIAKMQQAGTVTETSMGKSEKAAKKASVGLTDVEKAGAGMAIVLAGKAVLASADFEQAMSNVEAATHGSVAEMSSLEQAALDAGKATSFSATEAAGGIENLAKAGVEAAEITGGALAGALDLAAAGGMGVADAAEAAAGAMAQFKLEGEDVPHIADLLAAGAGKAQGEVSDMVMALKQAGTVSAQTGLSLEETVGTLSALAEQSLLGSDAGTSFKTMLAALTPNSNKAAKAMEQYNIHAFDAQGNFVGMTELAGQLQAGLGHLTDEQRAMALETIFGSDAVRAASIVYDNGAEGISKWTTQVDDAGYAAETAAIKMDNLKGDVEVLMGSIETALIGAGESSQDNLRSTTQLLTELVDAMSMVQEQSAINAATDQLSVVNSNAFKVGLNNLKIAFSDTLSPTEKLHAALFGVGEATEDAADSTEAGAAATRYAIDASGRLVEVTTGLSAATTDYQYAAAGAAGEVESFKDKLERLNAVLDGRSSLRDYEAALDDFTNGLKENGRTFDINTEKGRANQAALDNIAGSALAVSETMQGSARQRFLTSAIDDIRTMGQNMDLPKSEIKALIALLVEANQKDVKPKVDVDAAPAFASFRAIDQWMTALDGKRVTTYVDTVRTLTGPKGGAAFSQEAYGDVKNAHQPEIAAGGEWRVWAEPETQGESYIPHANDHRRPRAKRILEETASILGARSIEWFADGGSDSKRDRERRAEARRREEERRQRQLDNQRTRDLLASDLRNEQEQARLEARDAQRRLRSAREAGRPRSEIREARLTLKGERADLADMAEQSRIERKQAEDDRLAKLEEDRIQAEQERADAIFDGQQRAWDMATDAAKSQVEAAESLVKSVEANMDRIGDVATAAFKSNWFTQSGSPKTGLWTGADANDASDWRSRGTAEIEDLKQRGSLIEQLAALGVTGTALEDLLGNTDNAGIADLIAKGEADDYAALFKQREDLLGKVSAQAGVAGYGQDLSTAQAGFTAVTERLDRLNALIAASRPITVNEAISAEATAAEIARLEAMGVA